MYSELIHTRCRDGVDLMKNQAVIKGGSVGGFKTYACSADLVDDNTIDLPLLEKIKAEKQSYKDDSYMVDAYQYVTPDFGRRFLLSFHPVHFDRNYSDEDYPHRPGNFINQVFVGDFEDVYPYETFGNNDVWNAKIQPERYYYENAPTTLPPRKSLCDTVGQITFDEIRTFIAGGRRELLKQALSFLISQFTLKPEDRKYLIIRDQNSSALELWIAAIENAFSPRMASGLSFATRMNQFQMNNRYTVNLNGRYQAQINLQSQNQKLRYRAMIVGIDMQDQSNQENVKVLAGSRFVLLDGPTGALSESFQAADPYFTLVSSYTEAHEKFCRGLLQSVDIRTPGPEVFVLQGAFSDINNYRKTHSIRFLRNALSALDRFHLVHTHYLARLYAELKDDFPGILAVDPVNAFAVMEWLTRTAAVIQEQSDPSFYQKAVCEVLERQVYQVPADPKTSEMIHAAASSRFAAEALRVLWAPDTANRHKEQMKAYTAQERYCLALLFGEQLRFCAPQLSVTHQIILAGALESCCREANLKMACHISENYVRHDYASFNKVLLEQAALKKENNTGAEFYLELMISMNPGIMNSSNGILYLFQTLCDHSLESYFPSLLARQGATIRNPQEMYNFISWVTSTSELKEVDFVPLLQSMDEHLPDADPNYFPVACILQRRRPDGIALIHSANLYAVDMLEQQPFSPKLFQDIERMHAQGFPSCKDAGYIRLLVERMLRLYRQPEAVDLLVGIIASDQLYSQIFAFQFVKLAGAGPQTILGMVLDDAAQRDAGYLFDALANALANERKAERLLAILQSEVRTSKGHNYVSCLQQTVLAQQQKHSKFRWFSKSTNDDWTNY